MDCLAHAAQAATESRWSLFDLVGSGVAVTAADGAIEYCNSALLRLLAQNAQTLCGTSIFGLLDGGANGALESLHRAALAANRELRTQVHSSGGRFVAGAVLRRLDSDDRQRVIWSFVDARYNEPVPELALWGTEIGLWDWDVVNDRLTWINDFCEHSHFGAFSGYGHEQLWSSRIHPEDLPAYREALTRHLEGQTPPYDVEYRLRNRDDAWVWIQERGRVIERDPAGRACRAVGICLDAGERHKSARALERSEARLAHAVWGSSLGLWDIDVASDGLHWWNDWCADADLHPCDDGPYSAHRDVNVHPDDLANFNERYQALLDGRSDIYVSEHRLRTRSGNWRWVMSRGRATARDGAGRTVHAAGVTIDID